MELERSGEDISTKNKPKCIALGLGGGALAAIVLVAIVGAVGGGAWCYLQGPCAPVSSSSTSSGTAAPSAVLASDMKAELASGPNRRLRRRLGEIAADGTVALTSGTTIDATDLVAAGAKAADGQLSYSGASSAFIEGIAAYLKTSTKFTSLGTSDRAELVEITARTVVRAQVKHEMAPCRDWVDRATTRSTQLTSSSEIDALAASCKKELIREYALDGSDVATINAQHTSTKSFAENMKNISSTLASIDAGFANSAGVIVAASSISKGLAAGFVPRANDPDKTKFDTMQQSDMSSGMESACEGMAALSRNTKLLGKSDELVASLSAASSSFAEEAIKTAAKKKKPRARSSSSPDAVVDDFSPPLDTIASGSITAIGACDKSSLPKAAFEKALKGCAASLIEATSTGTDKSGAALNIETYTQTIARSMGEKSSTLTRDDLNNPADAMGPVMDGMLESLSKCPTSKIDKSSMSRIYGNCVGEMAKQAGKSSNVDASNLDATMQQLSELASEKTSYVAANRPDFEASELKIFAKETNEKVVKSCLEIDDVTKLPAGDVAKLISAASKGAATGAGKNTALATGDLIADYISSSSEGSSRGITSGATTSTRPEFKAANDAVSKEGAGHTETEAEKQAKEHMAVYMQEYSKGISGGMSEGALEIDIAKLPADALEKTFEGVSTAIVAATADMESTLPYFKPEHIANATKGITEAAAGALGKGSRGQEMSIADRKRMMNAGSKGALDGLKDMDTLPPALYSDSVAGIVAGSVAGLDDMSRNGATMSAADFKDIKDSTTTSISTDAATVGATLYAGNGDYDVNDVKTSIAGAEVDALKNVTSIPAFNPITALGASTCSWISDATKCTHDAMASICEWTAGGSCATRTTSSTGTGAVDMCDWATKKHQCTMSGEWCKWTPSAVGSSTGSGACAEKTSDEVTAIETTKTEPPTMAPTWQPTQPSTFDVCKVCIHAELTSARMNSNDCDEYVVQEQCDASPFAGDGSGSASAPTTVQVTKPNCAYNKVKAHCASVSMCAPHCDTTSGAPDTTMCCSALIASCVACMNGQSKEEYCQARPAADSTPGCGTDASYPTFPPTQLPTVDNVPKCSPLYCPVGWYIKPSMTDKHCTGMCTANFCCQQPANDGGGSGTGSGSDSTGSGTGGTDTGSDGGSGSGGTGGGFPLYSFKPTNEPTNEPTHDANVPTMTPTSKPTTAAVDTCTSNFCAGYGSYFSVKQSADGKRCNTIGGSNCYGECSRACCCASMWSPPTNEPTPSSGGGNPTQQTNAPTTSADSNPTQSNVPTNMPTPHPVAAGQQTSTPTASTGPTQPNAPTAKSTAACSTEYCKAWGTHWVTKKSKTGTALQCGTSSSPPVSKDCCCEGAAVETKTDTVGTNKCTAAVCAKIHYNPKTQTTTQYTWDSAKAGVDCSSLEQCAQTTCCTQL